MPEPPSTMGGGTVLRFASVGKDVRPTGATVHSYAEIVDGEIVLGEPLGPFAALAIVQVPDETGFYLFYLDDRWEIVTDTHHETLEAALHQAEFEYDGIAGNWIVVGEPG